MRRAEGHTLKGYKAKLISTDGGYLNIYNLGAGVRVADLQKRVGSVRPLNDE